MIGAREDHWNVQVNRFHRRALSVPRKAADSVYNSDTGRIKGKGLNIMVINCKNPGKNNMSGLIQALTVCSQSMKCLI